MHIGEFMYFHYGFFFFCDSQIHEGHCGISMLGCNYFVQKGAGASRSQVNK